MSEKLAMTGDARPVGNQQLSTRQGIVMQKQMKHSKFICVTILGVSFSDRYTINIYETIKVRTPEGDIRNECS